MEQEKLLKDVFKDFTDNSNLLNTKIMSVNLFKKSNKIDIQLKSDEKIELEEIIKFEQYIQNSIFEKNTVGYTNYAESGDISTVDLKLQDKTETEDGIYTMTVAMQLKEGTDFVMSFTMK